MINLQQHSGWCCKNMCCCPFAALGVSSCSAWWVAGVVYYKSNAEGKSGSILYLPINYLPRSDCISAGRAGQPVGGYEVFVLAQHCQIPIERCRRAATIPYKQLCDRRLHFKDVALYSSEHWVPKCVDCSQLYHANLWLDGGKKFWSWMGAGWVWEVVLLQTNVTF